MSNVSVPMAGTISSNLYPGRSSHRYLDVMTVRPSQGARPTIAVTSRGSGGGWSSSQANVRSGTAAISTNMTGNPRSNSAVTPARSSSHIHRSSIMPAPYTSSSGQSSHITENQRSTSLTKFTSRYTPAHTSLLIEPILLPNLQHVQVDNPQDLEESCLFYPNGHKNRNIRREIESSVVKHHLIGNDKLNQKHKRMSRYRIVRKDPYADAKGPPLVYTKKPDKEMKELLNNLRDKEGKIVGMVSVRL